MNYIIDPMWFYWIEVVDGLKGILLTFMILSIVATVIFFIGLMTDYDMDDKGYKIFKKLAPISASLTILFAVLFIFCPSKNSMIEMQVARFATYENAEWTIDTIKNAVDYIVQAIKSIK